MTSEKKSFSPSCSSAFCAACRAWTIFPPLIEPEQSKATARLTVLTSRGCRAGAGVEIAMRTIASCAFPAGRMEFSASTVRVTPPGAGAGTDGSAALPAAQASRQAEAKRNRANTRFIRSSLSF